MPGKCWIIAWCALLSAWCALLSLSGFVQAQEVPLVPTPTPVPQRTLTIPQPEEITPPIVEGPGGVYSLTPQGEAAVQNYLKTKEDIDTLINLYSLLRTEIRILLQDGSEQELENADALVFVTMSTVDFNLRRPLLQALDQIWNEPADYYDILLDAFGTLDRYRAWLGENRFRDLLQTREYLMQERGRFFQWREAQPPQAWRYTQYLVSRPTYEPREVRGLPPATPTFQLEPVSVAPVPRPVVTPPVESRQAQREAFPRSRLRGMSQGSPVPSYGYRPGLNQRSWDDRGSQRIIAPGTRYNPGTSTVTPLSQ